MKKKISLLICLVLISSLTIGDICGCSSKGGGQHQTAGTNDILIQSTAEASDGKADSTSRAEEIDTQDQQNTEGQKTEPAEAPAVPGTTRAMAESTATETPAEVPATAEASSAQADDSEEVDVDLTILSSTMVYSEVYNMISNPEEYLGKTVRMKGPFAFFHDEATDNYYFACIIQDATACCAQGIEFVLTEDYVYPDDYPEVDEEICVVGVFDTYMEGEYRYCTLRNARLQ